MDAHRFPSTLYVLLGCFVACGGGASTMPPAQGAASSAAQPAPTPKDPSTATQSRVCAISDAAVTVVEAPDRTEDDREIDGGRRPAEMLTFFRVAPGQRVADLAAAGGYTTELLARAVGPTGKVYGQKSPY